MKREVTLGKKLLRWKIMRTQAGYLLLLLMPLLAACVAGSNVTPQVVPVAPVPTGPVIAPLGEGREGFIITEITSMDDASRRDFDHAVALLNAQDYIRASTVLERLIEQSPGVTAPYINLAIAYRHLDKPEQAEAQLKAALHLVPDHPAACNEYGLLCRKAGRFEEAREIYQKVITRFPDFYPARKNLGILCDLYLNDAACALQHYEIYSAARPEDQQVKLWVADLRNRLGSN